MRTVTAGIVTEIGWVKTKQVSTGVETTQQHSRSYVPSKWSRSDIVVSKRDPTGWRKPTAYVSTKLELEPTAFEAVWTGPTEVYTYRDYATTQGAQAPVFEGSSTSLRSVLIYRALAAVKDEKINLAVALAEIGDVQKMIVKNFVKLRKAINLVKRGKWKKAYDVLGISKKYKAGARDLSAGWLEMIYGWLPLLLDVHGAIDEVNRKVLNEGATLVGRGKSHKDSTFATSPQNWYYYGQIKVHSHVSTFNMTHTQKVALWFLVDMPSLQRAAALGILNPGVLLWELTPFSFLADWVGTVGDWLNSLDATVGLTFQGGTHTYFERAVLADVDLTVYSGYSGTLTKQSMFPGSHLEERMDRAVITTVPEDKFVLTNPFSASHAITASALLITSLKKGN